MALTIIVTNAGRAALVNAANTGTAPVTIAQVGLSGTAVVPSPAATNLPGEFKRIVTISGDVVADDTIHMIVRDESSDVFTVRSLGLYLNDGTLFAIYGQAPVLVEKSAQAMMLIAIDVQFADVMATTLTFGDANFLNPPATTEQMGVVELATLAEAKAGADPARAITPATGKGSIIDWLGYNPVNRAGDNMTGSLSVAPGKQFSVDADPNWGGAQIAAGDALRSGYMNVLAPGGTRVGFLGYASLNGAISYTNERGGGHSFAGGIILRDGNKVWDAGNDGAGSGLDADLFQGQLPSYYTNIVARLGYTPANRAGDTFTGAIRRDANFSIDMDGSNNPYLGFDPNDYLWFNRSTNALNFVIGGVSRYSFGGDGWLTASGGFSANGNMVWHSGNDGAGSGLDADLFQGQLPSYYTNIVARLGYTPVNRAGDTLLGSLFTTPGNQLGVNADASVGGIQIAAGDNLRTGFINFLAPNATYTRVGFLGFASLNGAISYTNERGGGHAFTGGGITRDTNKVWDAGNDGAGSGLDADLLDGFHAASFLKDTNDSFAFRSATSKGYVGFNEGDATQPGYISFFTPDGVRRGFIGWSLGANNLSFTSQNGWGWNFSETPKVLGSAMWHVGNDGAGSGLDADLLDGLQASDFLRDLAHSFVESGYIRLSNGLIIQWGSIAGTWSANTDVPVSFPLTFPNAMFTIVGSNSDVFAQKDAVVGFNYTVRPGPVGFNFRTNVAGQNRLNWIAVGN